MHPVDKFSVLCPVTGHALACINTHNMNSSKLSEYCVQSLGMYSHAYKHTQHELIQFAFSACMVGLMKYICKAEK